MVAVFSTIGIVLGVTGDQRYLALSGLFVAGAIHLHQIYLNHVRWRNAMAAKSKS